MHQCHLYLYQAHTMKTYLSQISFKPVITWLLEVILNLEADIISTST